MANDKTYDRHINIWINGKEVKNSVSEITKEMFKLRNELANTTRGTKEYYEKAAELKRVTDILKDHRQAISQTGGAWTKMKDLFASAQGIVMAGVGAIFTAFQSIKGILTSTGTLSDKLEVTLGGWKSGIDAVARSVATLDFKNFGKNIKDAIEEGRRYAENLDEIDEKTRALMIAEAQAQNAYIDQVKIQRDVRKSLEERNAAGKEAIRIEEELTQIKNDIVKQAFENELINTTKIANKTSDINEQMKEEIKLYLTRNKSFMEGLEPAYKYRDILKQIQDLRKQEVYSTDELGRTTKLVDKDKEVLALQSQITDEMKRSNEVLTRVTIPTDEKYLQLAQKWVAVENVKYETNQKTLKVFTTNAKIENQITKEQSDAIEKKAASYKIMQDAIKNVRSERDNYYKVTQQEDVDKQVSAIRDRQLTDINNQLDIDSLSGNPLKKFEDQKIQNEINRRNEIADAEKTGASIDLINEKYDKIELARVRALQQAKLGIAADVFGKIATMAGEQTELGKAAAVAQGLINTYASAISSYNALAGIPIFGPALGFAAAAIAVTAGLMNVRKIMSVKTPEFFDGGYTGTGGKYEPRGIVHAGEWVANADMVASPAYGPIIHSLQRVQADGLNGYATGGGPGMNASGSGGSSVITLGQNPRLESLMSNIELHLIALRREGVSMRFGYREADNVRRGINRLRETEDDVFMNNIKRDSL